MMSVVRYALFAVCCSLLIAGCRLFAVVRLSWLLLVVVWCLSLLLFVMCCLLCVVCVVCFVLYVV